MSTEPRRTPARQWAGCEETHVSAVYLVGDKVLKVKKPVVNDFLDFTTVAARWRACQDEVRLNRRLSPDVYLGVAAIDLGEESPEPAVVMRRLADDDRLSTRLDSDPERLRTEVTEIARVIATFHERTPANTADDCPAAWYQLGSRWSFEWNALQALDPTLAADRRRGVSRHLGLRYLSGRRSLFDSRVRQGKVKDGHGDLRADHIYLTRDGVRIVDCLEFDPALRTCDVLADVTFLAMDLERLDRPQAARQLLDTYRELTDDVYPPSLAHFYIAQRALVRLKVALLARDARSRGATIEQDRLLGLAEQHLVAAQPHVICIGGLPGSGKSTIAAALASQTDAVYLSSDAIRHEGAGEPSEECAWGTGRYTPAETDAVYDELLRRATVALSDGFSVVLDASWRDTRHRDRAREISRWLSTTFIEVLCHAEESTAYGRLRGTRSGFSEAGVAVRREMRNAFDPWPTARVVSTDCELSLSVDAVSSLLAAADLELLEPAAHDPKGIISTATCDIAR